MRTGAAVQKNVLTWDRAPKGQASTAAFLAADLSAYDEPAGPTRLWDLHPSLHCSVIGTCLSNAELRQILKKAGIADAGKLSDIGLHNEAVKLSGARNAVSKLLDKALCRKHRGAIERLARAKTREEVLPLWQAALGNGEISGGYWAVLVHPLTDSDLVQKAFADVHMLSHLLGAANRADIAKLRELEQENGRLHGKSQEQRERFREAILKRDDTIGALRASLAAAVAKRASEAECACGAAGTGADETAHLKAKLEQQVERTRCLEARLEAAAAELADTRKECADLHRLNFEQRAELVAAEAFLAEASQDVAPVAPRRGLNGLAILYVGGLEGHIPHMKKLAGARGADFLHHDGGIEDNFHSLAALVARADAVLFPADCISHGAAGAVKRACRQLGKKYVPLRRAGLTSFASALERLEAQGGSECGGERGAAAC
jgi:Uncharacterized protein conserved in bacteria (DUF2325)